MNFTKLVPNVFYKDINTGLKIFVDCLEFEIGHSELDAHQPFCVLEKDGLRINLFQNAEFAKTILNFVWQPEILKKFMKR
ncbi:MAG: hypothetical protein DI622_05770 [Chryseobacterium sp.]|uniref:hypothetical protein n=1 Tax=Chryseobacterium sp. TaxID=1871047 RepID=UPI000DB2D0F2|nr:hypothetical protein [Chryseobacterium sp.]MPS66013.1 hypothetical protein [Chryseobacterium sp.]PZU22572.1 MAG: hypothetical protein DI622_05770 [Chryseobacterium sp.]